MWRLLGVSALQFANAMFDHPRPSQTVNQKAALSTLVAPAHTLSEDAKEWLMDYLDKTVKPALSAPYSGYTAEKLLEMFDWEFEHLPIIHNGPSSVSDPSVQAATSDDSDLKTVIDYGYLHNVCQRYALRIPGLGQNKSNLVGEHQIMVDYFDLPPFKIEDQPTQEEANDCILYYAANIQKTHLGNFIFGSVTYVINPVHRQSMTITPFDTGAYVPKFGAQFGYMSDYHHLVQPHVRIYGYNLAKVMERWWSDAAPTSHAQFEYFEYQLYDQTLLPESILYIMAKWSDGSGAEAAEGLAGKSLGTTLRSWMTGSKRPLIWADGSNTGMILDPQVCAGILAGPIGSRISAGDKNSFEDAWKAVTKFSSTYTSMPDYLHFMYLSYLNKDSCEEKSGNNILGVNGKMDCIFWKGDVYADAGLIV